ncbi:hypothetical protein ECG_08664 [Echinococcus granulosus]|nr:hypothetical protein ECG_08664 [Echinococcus granulosus]
MLKQAPGGTSSLRIDNRRSGLPRPGADSSSVRGSHFESRKCRMCKRHVAPCSMKVARDPKVNISRMPPAASASAWCGVVFLSSNEAQPRRGLKWSRIKHPNSW